MTRQRLAQLPIPPFSRDIGDGGDAQTWLQPIGITAYNPLDEAQMPLAGGPYGFSAVDVINAIGDAITVTRMAAGDVIAEATKGGDNAKSRTRRFLHRLTRPRKPYAGLAMDHWHVMGIINTTPDSFSDGGDHFAAETAL
jgi:dihydropteroate synthase